MCELLGLDKQLRSIRGSVKVEVAKKVQLEERIKKGKRKLTEILSDRQELKHRYLQGQTKRPDYSLQRAESPKCWTKTPH